MEGARGVCRAQFEVAEATGYVQSIAHNTVGACGPQAQILLMTSGSVRFLSFEKDNFYHLKIISYAELKKDPLELLESSI